MRFLNFEATFKVMKKTISVIIFSCLTTFAFAQQPERFSEEGDEKKETQKNVSAPETVPDRVDANPSKSKAAAPRRSSNALDRWRFGGNLGLGFGTYTYVNLAPRAYYLAKPNLGFGGGVSWYYWSDNRDIPPTYLNYKTSGNTWGVSLLSFVTPFADVADGLLSQITLHAEYEPLNFEVYKGYFDNGSGGREYVYEREWVHSMLLGGGLRQQAGRANIFILVLYDVLYDVNRSFYSSPWVIRIGAGF